MKSKSHATWLSGRKCADISGKVFVRVFPFRQCFLSVRFHPFRQCILWELMAFPVFHLIIGASLNCGTADRTDCFRSFISPRTKSILLNKRWTCEKQKNKTENKQNKSLFIRADQWVMLEIIANYIWFCLFFNLDKFLPYILAFQPPAKAYCGSIGSIRTESVILVLNRQTRFF